MNPLIEKVQSFAENFAVPIVVGIFGIALILVGLFSLLKHASSSSSIEFSNESSSSAILELSIDVEGAVTKPGVYQLPLGSRVSDGLLAAGGLSADADGDWVSQTLNRASKLVDGAKLYIPAKGETKISGGNVMKGSVAGASVSSLIGINSASKSQLEGLPGVGPVTAEKIINGRPYQTLEELTTKKIVGVSLFGKIKDLIGLF